MEKEKISFDKFYSENLKILEVLNKNLSNLIENIENSEKNIKKKIEDSYKIYDLNK